VPPRLAALLFGSFAFSTVSFADAHEFWLQPVEYWTSSDGLTAITLQVGHGPFRQRSPIPPRRITQFEAIAPEGATMDLRQSLHTGGTSDDAAFLLKNQGTYILVLQTDDQAQTHLPAIRFNDYLEVEGLTPALEQRARLGRMNEDGSERYSRCAKALVHVGSLDEESEGDVTKPVGLPLEIVPETNPYATQRASALPVRVFFTGHPLAGALVKLTDLENDASTYESHRTSPDGRAMFVMPTSGKWLLNVIWTQPSPPGDEADFETTFSSLSFGFASGVH
jgi:uncharacterized GH25 family protein